MDLRGALKGLDAGNRFVHAAVRAVSAREPLPTPPVATSWKERAGQHGVLAVLASHLDALADDELRSVRRRRGVRFLRTMVGLHRLQQVFDQAGIEWLVFKGPVLSEVVYQEPGTRNYGDLDLLVRPQDIDTAVHALMLQGAVPHDADWEALRAGGRGEMSMLLQNGTHLDLHWNVINDAKIRACFAVSTEELIAASREVRLGGLTVRTFCEVDTVLHLALHGAMSGGDRLRWLLDLQQSLLRCHVPPTDLLARARTFGLELVLRVMVNRVAAFVDDRQLVALPRPTLAQRSWLTADALAMQLRPPGYLWQGRRSGAVLVHSTRQRPGASWIELSKAGRQRIRFRGNGRDDAGMPIRPSAAL